jgi:hypothetical protein
MIPSEQLEPLSNLRVITAHPSSPKLITARALSNDSYTPKKILQKFREFFLQKKILQNFQTEQSLSDSEVGQKDLKVKLDLQEGDKDKIKEDAATLAETAKTRKIRSRKMREEDNNKRFDIRKRRRRVRKIIIIMLTSKRLALRKGRTRVRKIFNDITIAINVTFKREYHKDYQAEKNFRTNSYTLSVLAIHNFQNSRSVPSVNYLKQKIHIKTKNTQFPKSRSGTISINQCLQINLK